MSERDDEAWRAIVDNYGERARLEHEGDGADAAEVAARPEPRPEPRRDDTPPELRTWDEDSVDSDWTTDRFVPPPPPPVPTPTGVRLAAWLGVFGSPAVLLVCLVLGIPLPTLIAFGLVAAFVGGFLYLVFMMPRGPRDPGDDGARL